MNDVFRFFLGSLALLICTFSLSARELLLAEIANESIDPSGYLVSEKLDGVRAIWDGKNLRFRSGNIVPAPRWFVASLPKIALDGELWIGRGQFDLLSGIVRKQIPDDRQWRSIQYQIFELPDAQGSFEQRYRVMKSVLDAAQFSQLHRVEQRRVGTNAELRAWLLQVLKAGGEGLMLHRLDAPYVSGRSEVLLKLKAVLDAEATVLRHLPGKGKYAGMMGSLEVQTDEGKIFRLGTGFKDADRRAPPPIGARVTFNYRGLTKLGKPRFASFLRMRVDP